MQDRFGNPGKFLRILGVALVARLLIDICIARAGYYYGEDPDSFWRLGLSWLWSRDPFFLSSAWVPLQFAVVGSTFALLRPLADKSSMLVPVLWNHAFFLGSLALTYLAARRLGGLTAGLAAVVLATTMTEDIWTTYSGLSEPLTIACALAVAYCLLMSLDTSSHNLPCYALGAGIAAGLASANHYLGWSLLPVAVGLAGLILAKPNEPGQGRPTSFYAMLLASLCVSALFPMAWLVANYRAYGDPFYFLSNAQGFHPWVTQLSISARLETVPDALWSAAPFLLVLACFAVPFTARQQRKSLALLVPMGAYLAVLALSAVQGYGVADMHNRYALVPLWLSLPFIGFAVSALVHSGRRLPMLAGLALVAVPAISGIERVAEFYNWVDSNSREVTELVQGQIRDHDDAIRVVIESETCLYPVAGIADGVARPDWVRLRPTTDLLQIASGPEAVLRMADLVVITNPLTLAAFADQLAPLAEIGDYTIARPSAAGGLSVRSANLPQPWQYITDDAFRRVDANGTIYFAFDPSPAYIGDAVGLRATLDVPPNGCRILRAEVQDRYEPELQPWTAVQQLVVNDIVIWSHDLSGERLCGWQQVDAYLMPTSSRLDVQLRVVALTGPSLPIDWRLMSLTGVRNLSISDCP